MHGAHARGLGIGAGRRRRSIFSAAVAMAIRGHPGSFRHGRARGGLQHGRPRPSSCTTGARPANHDQCLHPAITWCTATHNAVAAGLHTAPRYGGPGPPSAPASRVLREPFPLPNGAGVSPARGRLVYMRLNSARQSWSRKFRSFCAASWPPMASASAAAGMPASPARLPAARISGRRLASVTPAAAGTSAEFQAEQLAPARGLPNARPPSRQPPRHAHC